MNPNDTQVALAALQALINLGLTGVQVKSLMDLPKRTAADVEAQLNATDATIERLRDED